MRFIHFADKDNLNVILSRGIIPGAIMIDRWDAFGDNTPRVFCDILFEDNKARYNGWLELIWDKSQSLEIAKNTVGIVFELPADDIIYIGPWGFPAEAMMKISVVDFELLLSSALQKIQSKWIKPVNVYDYILGRLFDYKDIKETVRVGCVFHFFKEINVASVKLEEDLDVGDRIEVKGTTTNFVMNIDSMQIQNSYVKNAKRGDKIGIRVCERVRKNDVIHKITLNWANPFIEMTDLHYRFLSFGFEVQVPHSISPDLILGHKVFDSKNQLQEAWYNKELFE